MCIVTVFRRILDPPRRIATVPLVMLLLLTAVTATANVIENQDPPNQFQNSCALTIIDPPLPGPVQLVSSYMSYPSLAMPFGVGTSYSHDGGVTWFDSPAPPPSALGLDDDPHIASGAGFVYVVSASADAPFWGGYSATGIFVSTSGDGGVNFGPPMMVSMLAPPFWQTEPKIDSDNYPTSPYMNNVYTTWELDQPNGINGDIMFAVSADFAQTFPVQTAVNDNNGSDLALWPDLDIADTGDVTVGWLDTPLGAQHQGTIYVDRTTDAGMTFGPDVPAITFWTVPAWLRDTAMANTHNAFSYCSVAVDPSNSQRIGVAFAADPDDGPCAETKLDQDPVDFATARMLNPFSGGTTIANGSSFAHACWIDERNAPHDVMYRGTDLSLPPTPWSGNEIVVSNQPPFDRRDPQNANLAVDGSNVYITWDQWNGIDYAHLIWFNYSHDDGVTWQPQAFYLDHSARVATEPLVTANGGNNVCVAWLHESLLSSTDLYCNYSTDGGTTFQPAEIRVPNVGRVYDHDIASVFDGTIMPTNLVYLVWSEDDPGGAGSYIWFSRSITGGATWAPPTRIDSSPMNSVSYAPKVCCSPNNVYVTWVDGRSGADDIYFAVNNTQGAGAWSFEQQIEANGPGASRDYCSQMACFGNDVYIVYESDRLAGPATEDIYVAVSNDGGVSFAESRLDTGDPLSNSHSVYPRVATGGTDLDSYAFVVWQDDRNRGTGTNYDIYGNISWDSGATWMASDYRVDTATQPGRYNSEMPHVAGGPGLTYQWRDARGPTGHEVMANMFRMGLDDGDILYTESLDGGQTWLHPPLRVNDDPGTNDQSHPWIDIKPNGIVDVGWIDHRGSALDQDYETYFAALLPGQAAFTPNVPVTNMILAQPASGWWVGDYIGLVVDDTHAHIDWFDTRRDGAFADIYYANLPNPGYGACCLTSATCVGATEAECEEMSGVFMGEGTVCEPELCVAVTDVAPDYGGFGLRSCPNPFNPRATVSYTTNFAAPVHLKVFDLKGRFVTSLIDEPHQEAGAHRVTWDGRDAAGRVAPAGVYFVQLQVGSEIENLRVMLVK